MATKKTDVVTSTKEVTTTIDFILLKQSTAPKISPKNPGSLTYQIGKNPESDALALRMVESDSGGYFSKEWIELETIKSLLDSLEADKPFKSSALRSLFNGGSSNNAGFCAAVCRAEGILTAVPGKTFLHQKGHPVADWIAEVSKLKPMKAPPKSGKAKPEPSTKTKAAPSKSKSLFAYSDSSESTDAKPENDI